MARERAPTHATGSAFGKNHDSTAGILAAESFIFDLRLGARSARGLRNQWLESSIASDTAAISASESTYPQTQPGSRKLATYLLKNTLSRATYTIAGYCFSGA